MDSPLKTNGLYEDLLRELKPQCNNCSKYFTIIIIIYKDIYIIGYSKSISRSIRANNQKRPS